jgi:hypothetical protein
MRTRLLGQAFLAVTRVSRGKVRRPAGRRGVLLRSGVLPLSTAAIRGLLAATTLLRAVGVAAAGIGREDVCAAVAA